MTVRLGGGEWTFEVNENWAKIPDEIALGDCAAVGVDSKDNVYAFNRGEHPVAVFDQDGNLLRTWGEGVFIRPHGVHVAPDDTIWLTDDGDHTVRHCTLDGRVLMTLGIPGKPSPYMSGEPFHRCTHTALSPQWRPSLHLGRLRQRPHPQIHGRRQIAEVLGRARHRSRPVQHPAQYLLRSGRLDLCRRPREPPRAGVRRQRQVGDAVEQPAPAERHVPGARRDDPLCYIGEGGPSGEINRDWPNIGPRVCIHTTKGKVLARLGKPHGGMLPGQFTSPHGIAVDSRGNIYVGELSGRSWSRFAQGEAPRKRRVIHKLVKVAA